MESDTVFVELVDSIVRDFAKNNLPQNPQIIASALSEVFCRGFSEKDYRLYTAQIELFVRERIVLFLAQAEINEAKLWQN